MMFDSYKREDLSFVAGALLVEAYAVQDHDRFRLLYAVITWLRYPSETIPPPEALELAAEVLGKHKQEPVLDAFPEQLTAAADFARRQIETGRLNLKACPFCKKPGQVQANAGVSGASFYAVGCLRQRAECAVSPRVSGSDLEKLERDWNARV